ncbi:MAG: hypothetical protein ACI8P0_001538 [Planctomycetaceae bacterium]|jgi:hypothetical protein
MKLVDPGPQPPPFEVEYSELEADKPRTEPPEEEPSPIESSVEVAAVAQPAAKPEDSLTLAAKLQSTEDAAASTAEPVDDHSGDRSDDVDSFGAGLDAGDVAPEPGKKEQPDVAKESAPTSGEGAAATDSAEAAATDSATDPEKKKSGKRPNRRRRSRRGQKKDGGSAPKSES